MSTFFIIFAFEQATNQAFVARDVILPAGTIESLKLLEILKFCARLKFSVWFRFVR